MIFYIVMRACDFEIVVVFSRISIHAKLHDCFTCKDSGKEKLGCRGVSTNGQKCLLIVWKLYFYDVKFKMFAQ